MAVQGNLDGALVTVMIEGDHKLRQLKGKSYVAVEPVTVAVDDRAWDEILGVTVVIHGGGELRVRGDALDQALEGIESADSNGSLSAVLIPMEIRDPHYPQAGVLVRYGDLLRSFNEIDPGTGPHSSRGLSDCKGGLGRKRQHCSCARCFYDWWTARADERGINVKS